MNQNFFFGIRCKNLLKTDRLIVDPRVFFVTTESLLVLEKNNDNYLTLTDLSNDLIESQTIKSEDISVLDVNKTLTIASVKKGAVLSIVVPNITDPYYSPQFGFFSIGKTFSK